MKILCLLFLFQFAAITAARADLTIVENIQSSRGVHDMTIKIKGDKVRVDMERGMSSIFDSKTGEMVQVMSDQKMIIRMSADKLKAATDLMKNYRSKDQPAGKPKLVPSGKKETVNGYEAEEYISEGGTFKVSYWLAPKFPNGAAVLKQLQTMTPLNLGDRTNLGMPDYRDLPAFPIKTVINVGGSEIVTTVTSIKQDPVSDTEFVPPNDFKNMEMPDLGRMMQPEGVKGRSVPSPSP